MKKFYQTLLFIITVTLLKLNSVYSQDIPFYFNDFENLPQDTIGWKHYAISGVDDWEIGELTPLPSGWVKYESNLWNTNLDENSETYSERVLETPYFNFSDTSRPYIISMSYAMDDKYNNHCYFEYSLDSGITWQQLFDENDKRRNWVLEDYGFAQISVMRRAASELNLVIGYDNVKFRFRYVTNWDVGEGFYLDNFKIDRGKRNAFLMFLESKYNVSKNFSIINVEYHAKLDDYYDIYDKVTTAFYLSNDTILDSSDVYLNETEERLSMRGHYKFNAEINLPDTIKPRKYYLIAKVDPYNVIDERNEFDNIRYGIIQVDKTYDTPLLLDFEDELDHFIKDNSLWKRGTPNLFHGEKASSGKNTWIRADYGVRYDFRPPDIDWSNFVFNCIC